MRFLVSYVTAVWHKNSLENSARDFHPMVQIYGVFLQNSIIPLVLGNGELEALIKDLKTRHQKMGLSRHNYSGSVGGY